MSTTSIFELRKNYISPLGNWEKESNKSQFIRHYFEDATIVKKSNINIFNKLAFNTNNILDWFIKNSNPNYSINIFFDSDGLKLLTQYKQYPIKDNEVAIFFETDDKFNLTNSLYRIRLGKLVIEDLKKWFYEKGEIDDDELADLIVKKFPKTKEIGKRRLIKLIKDEVSKDSWTFNFQYFFSIIKFHPLDILNVFDHVGDWLESKRPKEKKYWDPTSKDYSPILIFPKIIKHLDEDKIASAINDSTIKNLDDFFKGFRQKKDQFIRNYNVVIPDSLEDIINNKYNIVEDFYYDEIRPNLKAFIEAGITIIKETAYIINAFITGIVSGLLTLISGVIKLFGFLLRFDLDKDYKDAVYEKIENLIQDFFTDIKKNLKLIFNKLKLFINDLISFENKYELSFKIGELIFEIAESIIAILKFAKAKKIANLLKTLEKERSPGKTQKKVDELDKLSSQPIKKKVETKQVYARNKSKSDINRISNIRKKYEPRPTRNVAFCKGKIGDVEINLEVISGGKKTTPWQQKGNFKTPEPENYHFKNGPEAYKINHTEQNIFEYLYDKFKNQKNVSGEIDLVSDLRYCKNCYWISEKFLEEFPNVIVNRVFIVEKLNK